MNSERTWVDVLIIVAIIVGIALAGFLVVKLAHAKMGQARGMLYGPLDRYERSAA